MRFILVGAFNTAFGYALYLWLLSLGYNYLVAYGISVPIGLIVAFVLSGHVVFGNLKANRFLLFVLAWAIILLVNVMLLGLLVAANIPASIAPILLLPVTAAASYTVQKLVVFRKPSITSQPELKR